MATQAEKALAAVREYDRLMLAISTNTTDINKGLEACERRQLTEGDDWNEPVSYIPDGKQTHLAEAFEPFDDSDGYFPMKGYNPPEEIAEIISECEGCKKAYAAIIERKANRKKLGIIKRSMRAIARGKWK